MSFFKNIFDKIKKSEDFEEIKSSSFKDILNGNIFSKKMVKKQYPFLILIAVLAVIYTANGITFERQITQMNKLKIKRKDIKYHSLGVSAELTNYKRRTTILKRIEQEKIGLIEGKTAPILIKNFDKKEVEDIIKEKENQKIASEKIKNDTTSVEE